MNNNAGEIIKALRMCADDQCSKHCLFHVDMGKEVDCISRMARVAVNLIEAMQQERRWIPVTERLPEDGFEVLVYTDRYGGRHEFAYYVPRLGAWYQNCALLIPNVTHWMPLAKAPKEDK